MKEKIIIFGLLIVCSFAFSQGISFKTNFVKSSGQTTPQQDTLAGRTTLGARITGAESVTSGTKADTVWYLTSTGMDTSRVYRLESGSVTFHVELDDTSTANDSAMVRLIIYTAPKLQFRDSSLPPFASFVYQDSVDFKAGTTSVGVQADSDVATSGVNGQGTYEYTYTSAGSNRPGHDFWYITIKGISGTKVLSAVEIFTSVTYAW